MKRPLPLSMPGNNDSTGSKAPVTSIVTPDRESSEAAFDRRFFEHLYVV
jgi:hypothetical protein